MLPRVDYLSWAIETFPHARWDLATSGLPSISSADLGVPANLSDPAALRAFAQKIAARYGVPEGEVVPALGTSGAVWMAAASVLPRAAGEAPFEVLVEEPTYEPLLRVVEGLGAIVKRVQRPENEEYRLDPARVAAALTDRTRLVVLASPHNPTGLVTPDEDIAAIAKMCEARGAYLLVDEVYRELVAPATTARRLGPNVIAVSSLTKCFGVGWARAGWAILPVELRAAARAAEMHATGTLPSTSGAVGAHAMDRIDDLAARAISIAEGKRAIVDAFLAKHPELAWTPPPPRALFGFVRAPGIDVAAGLARALSEHGLAAVPGAFFGAPGGFRLSWASLPKDRLAQALSMLATSLGLAP
ncbi:MAG: pyridoxal phosphate-dependent aminotransferase [Polyangiaceae bacterium]